MWMRVALLQRQERDVSASRKDGEQARRALMMSSGYADLKTPCRAKDIDMNCDRKIEQDVGSKINDEERVDGEA